MDEQLDAEGKSIQAESILQDRQQVNVVGQMQLSILHSGQMHAKTATAKHMYLFISLHVKHNNTVYAKIIHNQSER